MSILTDLLVEMLESGMSPSSGRGLVGAFAVGSLGFGSVTLWLVLAHSPPLAHPWGFGACAGSLAIGGAGLWTSLLHLFRDDSDRAFAVLCLMANLGAIGTAAFGVVSR